MKNKILTIPNLLSFSRLCLLPIIIYSYIIQHDYKLTVLLLLISGITDLLDGIIARRFHMVSDLGKILDPVADKATQVITLLCLITRFKWLMIPLICILIKELFMTFTGLLIIHKTQQVHSAQWHGKIATFMLDFMVILHVFYYNIPQPLSYIIMIITTFCILQSFYYYAKDHISLLKKMG